MFYLITTLTLLLQLCAFSNADSHVHPYIFPKKGKCNKDHKWPSGKGCPLDKRHVHCRTHFDCPSVLLCCRHPNPMCGGYCLMPILTNCETHQKNADIRRIDIRPDCLYNGEWNPVQIDETKNPEESWCVDMYGHEKPNTRVIGEVVTCKEAAYMLCNFDPSNCKTPCHYGFGIRNGCPVCDYCLEKNCTSDMCPNGVSKVHDYISLNGECDGIDVPCKDSYCPRVIECLYEYKIDISTTTTSLPFKQMKKYGSCPEKQWLKEWNVMPSGICPKIGNMCETDNDCPGTRLCCKFKKDCPQNVCTPPKLTKCHLEQMKADLLLSLGIHRPDCLDNGQYNPVQVHEYFKQSWCVDKKGIEIPGTRVGNGAIAKCKDSVSRADVCPLCQPPTNKPCPYGYEMFPNGCLDCDSCMPDPCIPILCPVGPWPVRPEFYIKGDCMPIPIECGDQEVSVCPLMLPECVFLYKEEGTNTDTTPMSNITTAATNAPGRAMQCFLNLVLLNSCLLFNYYRAKYR